MFTGIVYYITNLFTFLFDTNVLRNNIFKMSSRYIIKQIRFFSKNNFTLLFNFEVTYILFNFIIYYI